jgi:hypothetical protein
MGLPQESGGGLPDLRLYVALPEPQSLEAIKALRRLAGGEWAGRCQWMVADVLSPPAPLGDGAPPRIPALARVTPGGLDWLPGDPSNGIEAGWLDRPSPRKSAAGPSQSGPPGERVVAGLWRTAMELAPFGCALFMENGWLVYANAVFRQKYRLENSQALGRHPTEWSTAASVRDLAGLLAPEGERAAPADLSAESISTETLSLKAVYLRPGPVGDLALLLESIRTTNHAIGNALVGILGYGELLQQDTSLENSAALARVEAMASAARRVDLLSQEISAAIRQFLKK